MYANCSRPEDTRHESLYPTHRPGLPAGPCQCRHRPDHSQAVSQVDQAHRLRSQPVRRVALPGRGSARSGLQHPPDQPGLRAELPALPGCQRAAGPRELRLRFVREHAPWALDEYGFRTIIAPSFADIFYNNSFKNGLLPIVLKEEEVDALFEQTEANEGYQLTIDLEAQTVTRPDGVQYRFEVDAFRKHCLLNGLDDIGLTLQDADAIKAFEARHRASQPWLFGAIQ